MPWCPKCKNEYVEGITTCADCGVELVDELPEEIEDDSPVKLCHTANEEIGAKLIIYLNAQGVRTAGLFPVPEYDEAYEGGFYVVMARPEYREPTILELSCCCFMAMSDKRLLASWLSVRLMAIPMTPMIVSGTLYTIIRKK